MTWTLLSDLRRVILEKLTVSQFVKKFLAFYAFTSARHPSLSWARSIHLLTYIIINILITCHAWEITEMQTEFCCEHAYTDENHNNALYQARLWHLKQRHLQDISNSTPTRDLKEHTFIRPHAAHLQDVSKSTSTGNLKQHTFGRS